MAIRSSERKPAEIPPLLLVALDIRKALIEALTRVRALENFIVTNSLTPDEHMRLDRALSGDLKRQLGCGSEEELDRVLSEDLERQLAYGRDEKKLKANARRALTMKRAEAAASEAGVVARNDQKTAIVKKTSTGRQRARAGRRRAQG